MKSQCVRFHFIWYSINSVHTRDQVANHLYCGAKVVGGHEPALKFLEDNKSDFKIRRTKRLAVSGAFHTPLMAPALEVFSSAVAQTRLVTMNCDQKDLNAVRFTDPRIPIYTNVTGEIVTKGVKVQKNLTKQLVQAVRWETAVNNLFKVNLFICNGQRSSILLLPQIGPNDRPPMVYECGPGQTLSAMLGKINGRAASNCQFIAV